VRAIIRGRRYGEFESLGSIKRPNDDEVRKAFNVRQAGLEMRLYFKDSFGLVRGAEPLRDLPGIAILTSYISDRLHGKHQTYLRCIGLAATPRFYSSSA
jgi:hypothetical protein